MTLRRGDVEVMLKRGQPLTLNGQDLRGADLSGLDLAGADLAYARLEGTSFQRARLAGAVLWAATATGADFTGADLSDANLGTADQTGARLDGAVLRRASLLGTTLTGTSRRADLPSRTRRGLLCGGDHGPIHKPDDDCRAVTVDGLVTSSGASAENPTRLPWDTGGGPGVADEYRSPGGSAMGCWRGACLDACGAPATGSCASS